MTFLLSALLAVALILQGSGKADSPQLSVSSVPFGPKLDQISLRVRGGENSVSQTLYLRQSGEQPLADVRLFVIVEGRPAAVSFGSGDTLSVPEQGTEIDVHLTWTDVITSGSAEGELIATATGRHQTIAKVKISKDTKQPLHLLEAASDAVKLTSTTTAFLNTFHIVSDVDYEIEAVQIAVEPLVDSRSQQVMPRIEVDGSVYDGSPTLRIPGRATKAFVLRTELPRAGSHKGALALRWRGGEKTVPLEVTRTQVPAGVQVYDIANVRITLGEEANLQVALRETEGHTVDLPKPTLLALLHKIGTDEVQVGEATLNVGWESKPLGPRESRIVQLTIGGVSKPGEYKSSFQFGAGDGPPTDKSVKIFVRREAKVAAVLIAAGTLVSAALRWFLTIRKSQLTSQRQAIDLNEDLKRIATSFNSLGEKELQIVESLRDRIAVLFREATADTKVPVQAGLDEVGRKLPILANWLRIRASFEGSEIPDDVRAKFLQVEQFLRRRDTTANDAAAQNAILQELERTIEGLPTVQQAIKSLQDEVAERSNIANPPSELIKVRALLNEAAVAANKGLPAADKVRSAQDVWRNLLFSDLEEILRSTGPPGVDPGDWQGLTAKARTHLSAARAATDHDEGIVEYQAGLAIALGGMISGLQKTVSKVRQNVQPTKELAFIADEIASLPVDISQKYDVDKLTTIQKRYNRAVEALMLEIESTPAARGFKAAISPQSVPRAPSILAKETFVVKTIEVAASPLLPRWKVNTQIYGGEVLVTGALLAIAVFMGLQLLYFPNAIWGSSTDCVTALLWGLGVHEIGNTSFQGVRGLRATFAAPSST